LNAAPVSASNLDHARPVIDRRKRGAALCPCHLRGGGMSDTALSWRIGNRFREPFDPLDIRKYIFALTHAGGYRYPRHADGQRRRHF
jgi:hypothetical protein